MKKDTEEMMLFVGLPGSFGAALGSRIGIVGFGTAIAGTIPVGAAFATVGLLAKVALDNARQNKRRR